jgi:hypothetical protein
MYRSGRHLDLAIALRRYSSSRQARPFIYLMIQSNM